MDASTRSELLSLLGAAIVVPRHQAIYGVSATITDQHQDRVSCAIVKKIAKFSPQQREAVGVIVLEAVDSALVHFLETLAGNEDLDLTISKDGKKYSVRELSEDIRAEY